MRERRIGKTTLKVGKFLSVDRRGFLQNDASLEKIPSRWRKPVSELVDAYVLNLGKSLQSVYIRGSIVRGEPIGFISDIDSIAIVSDISQSSDEKWMEDLRNRFEAAYPFVAGLELRIILREDFLTSDKCLPDRFILKTQGVCLWGRDSVRRLKRFRPDETVIKALHGNLGEIVDTACSVLRTATGVQKNAKIDEAVRELIEKKGMGIPSSPEAVKKWCQWAMKRMIRGGFALVMEAEKKYTRDLYLCYEAFSRHYPASAVQMRKALELAVEPSGDPHVTLALLESLGRSLVSEMKKRIG